MFLLCLSNKQYWKERKIISYFDYIVHSQISSELIAQTIPDYGHIPIQGMKLKKLLLVNVCEVCK